MIILNKTKPALFVAIISLLLVSCNNSRQDTSDTIVTNSLSTKGHALITSNNIIKLQKENNKKQLNNIVAECTSNNVVNIKEIEKSLKLKKSNPFTMSYEDKLDILIEEFKLDKMDKSRIQEPGISDISELVNKMFDVTRPVTSNDIECIKRLDINDVFKIADRAGYHHVPRERVLQLYEIIIDNNPPKDIKIRSYLSCAHHDPDNNKRKELLDKTIKFGEENNQDSEVAKYESEALHYWHSQFWNNREYDKTLDICDKIIEVATLHPDEDWSVESRGEAYFWKVYALSFMGRIKEGQELYKKAIKLKMHPATKRNMEREKLKKRLKLQ